MHSCQLGVVAPVQFWYLSVRTQLRDIHYVVCDCLVCLSNIWIGIEQHVVLYATLTDVVLCARP